MLNDSSDSSFVYKFGSDFHMYVGQNEGGSGYISFGSANGGNQDLPDDYVAFVGSQFEAKLPKSALDSWRGEEISAWADQGYETVCRDHIELPEMDLF